MTGGKTGPKPRRLRFNLDVLPDESVPGAIARGVAGHHLVRLGYVLREAGLGRYAGLTQLADAAELARLAHVIRCDGERLTAQAGRRLIEAGDRRLQHFIDFDGLVVPRGHLELRRRRIAPVSLVGSPHHRQAWLMTILPYCPASLERLVDTCSRCDATLGWTTTFGVDCCEACEKVILPSSAPPLAEELAEDYRLFARLLSLQPTERSKAVGAMPARLARLAPGELARLAMRCGLDCNDDAEKRAWQTRAGKMSPERLAATAVCGIALLRSWPVGIADWAVERVAQATDEAACRLDLKRRISRIAWGDSGFSDQRRLLGEVFPGLEPPARRTPPGGGFSYTGRQVDRMLPGFKEHAAAIRRSGAVPHRRATNCGDITTYLYSVPEIDAAEAQWKDAISIPSIMDELQLPFYAMEQFFEAGLLSRCANPLLAVILRRPMAIASTRDTLVKGLLRGRSRRKLPTDALPIGHESHRIGGRAKPWSDIYDALISRRIPFWMQQGVSTEQLLVERGSLDTFLNVTARATPLSGCDMTSGDAAELLNVIPGDVRRLRKAGILPRTVGLRAITTPRSDVERLAADYVSAAELARRSRTSAVNVNELLRSMGLESYHGLWSRRDALGVLPLR